jgi:DNA-binding IclR family transcriptional regulator
MSDQTFETGVTGFAAPLFDSSGIAGAVAVAAVSSRVTPELQTIILTELIKAARTISANWGGTIPPALAAAWAAQAGPETAP